MQPAPIVFTLPCLLPLPNRTRGEHWTATRDRKPQLAREVWAALNGRRPAEPLARSRVTVWRHGIVEPDFDNLAASLKSLLDVLQPVTERRTYGLGLIADDAPSACDIRPRWIKAGRRVDQRTVVEVVAL